jgi:hypothetical protein
MKKNYGVQSIEQKLASLLKPMFVGGKKEFVLINNLVKNWDEIVGKKYAQFCYPKKVSLGGKNFSQKKSAFGKAAEGSLTIAVFNSSVGFFLENNSEIILERIAIFYGFKVISKIIIKQEPKNINVAKALEIKLSSQEENFLQEKLSTIPNQDLAQTLQKLGREIFKK